jgi:hypothetical protein
LAAERGLEWAGSTSAKAVPLLRPGNATANGVADHLAVLDAALAQLPAAIADGHRVGDDRAAVGRAAMVRTDSAGASHGFVGGCRERNVGFAVVSRKTPSIHAAISAVCDDEAGWVAAIGQHDDELAGSSVRELTDGLHLSAWPQGTRLIVRREPRHPGAQTSLFPNLEFRFWGHTPTKPATRPASMLTCAPTPKSRTTSAA